MPTWLEGLLGGINATGEANRTAREKAEAEGNKFESDQLTSLINNEATDPEVKARAATALIQIAAGEKRPRGGYLSRMLGVDPIQAHPAVSQLLSFMKSPETVGGGIPVRVPNAPAAATPTVPLPTPAITPPAGSAAMAAKPVTNGGGPVSPAVVGSPGGGTAVPAVTPPPSPTPQAPPQPQALPVTAPPKDLGAAILPNSHLTSPPGVEVPRQIFRDPGEMVRTKYVNEAQGQVEGRIAGRMAAGMSREDALALEKKTAAGGAGSIQGVAGELPDGGVAFGILDKRPTSPTYGKYIDPDTDEVIPGFRPRTTSASTSSGINRDGAARFLFGRSFAQLKTPEERQAADNYAVKFAGELAGAQTTGRGEAAAHIPLSTDQQMSQTRDLQKSWLALDAPLREMRRNLQIMNTAIGGFDGDPVGTSEAVRVAFEKILDPTSVVREGEYARQGEGLSLLDRLDGLIQKYASGGGAIPKDILQQLVTTANTFANGLNSWNDAEGQRLEATASAYGIDPRLIRGLPPVGGSGTVGTPPPTVPGTAPKTPVLSPPPSPANLAGPPAADVKVGQAVGNRFTGDIGTIRQLADGRLLGKLPNGTIVELQALGGQYFTK